MKTIKKISIFLILSLAVFVCVEKDCFSLSDKSAYVIENPNDAATPDNTLTSEQDFPEVEVTLTQSIYTFNLQDLSCEKVIVSHSFFPQNIYFCIWQPPRVS